MKLCKDCKYYQNYGDVCNHPHNVLSRVDPVTGKPWMTRNVPWCDWQRKGGRFYSWLEHRCGLAGRWYEEK